MNYEVRRSVVKSVELAVYVGWASPATGLFSGWRGPGGREVCDRPVGRRQIRGNMAHLELLPSRSRHILFRPRNSPTAVVRHALGDCDSILLGWNCSHVAAIARRG